MITAVNLNPTTDVVVPVDKLKPGKVSRTRGIFSYPGGKGTNVARALASLGADVASAGFSAENELAGVNSFLRKYRVAPYFTGVKGANRICVLITEKSGKSETIINSESSITINKKDIDYFFKTLCALSEKSSFVTFSGSLPVSLPPDFYKTAIAKVRGTASVLLDTSSKYLKHGIKASPHIIKQNIHELEAAFSVRLGKTSELKKFMVSLAKEYRIETVIVTLNEKGSLFYSDGTFLAFPGIRPAGFLSPVGSGDAFTAGLVYALERGFSMREAGRWAVACATANLSHLGSCFITKRETQKYLPEPTL